MFSQAKELFARAGRPIAERTSRHLGTMRILGIFLVVFFAGALLPEVASASAYWPERESEGGWRSLVQPDGHPDTLQRRKIRDLAGIDWEVLEEAAEYSRGFSRDHAVLVIRKGWIVGEWGTRRRVPWASVAKSVTGLVAAHVFARGHAAPETPAHRLLPVTWAADGAAKRAITLRHLMTMASGLEPHDRPRRDAAYARTVLTQPVEHPPLRVWSYASLPVDLLGMAIARATGLDVERYFRTHIGRIIGAAPRFDRIGPHRRTSSGFHATPRDLARIGYLLLREGRWRRGRRVVQVLPRQWVEFLRSAPAVPASARFEPTPGSPFVVEPDAPSVYGHLWWTNRNGRALGRAVPRDAFYVHGFNERLLVVIPSLDLVVVRWGQDPDSLPRFRREFVQRVVAAVTRR